MTWNLNKQDTEQKEETKENIITFKSLKEVQKTRGIKVLSYGNFSTGKTHFALSSPGPVYIIDTENGSAPLADKFPDAKVINISSSGKENIDEKDEVNNFQKYMDVVDYLITLPDDEIGTIIVDSISDIWEWAQAYGKVKVFKINVEDRLKQQWDWAIINKLYLSPLKKLINKNCNLVLTARETEVYNGPGKPSGIFEPKCQKKTPYWVDVALYHELKYTNKKIHFQCRVTKCRQNGNIIGNIISEPSLDKIKKIIKKDEK